MDVTALQDRTVKDVHGKEMRLITLNDLSEKCEVDMRELLKCRLRHVWARTIHTFQVCRHRLHKPRFPSPLA